MLRLLRLYCIYHEVQKEGVYGQIKQDVGIISRKLCQQKEVEIIEARTRPGHIHMLISITLQYSVSQIMVYLKGKNGLIIFGRHINLKNKYRNRYLGPRIVDTVGRNKKQIA